MAASSQKYLKQPTKAMLQQYDWYFGSITHEEAKSILLQNGENEGTFLIRDIPSRDDLQTYELSVLDWQEQECIVHHYVIEYKEQTGFFIKPDQVFESVSQLVNWFSKTSTWMPVKLANPCPNPNVYECSFPPARIIYSYFVDRSTVSMETKLSGRNDTLTEIWKGTFKRNNQQVALKIQNRSLENQSKSYLLKEAEALIVLRHCNIVPLIAVVESTPTCLVMQYQPNNDLLGYCLNSQNQISYVTKLRMVLEVANALRYVSEMKYVHRNVRAANVLLDGDLTCKLTGFGRVAKLDENGNYFATEGEPPLNVTAHRWMAIESLNCNLFSTPSDVWSFAVLLHEIFTNGELPYSGYYWLYHMSRCDLH